jgi:hypothetical protein
MNRNWLLLLPLLVVAECTPVAHSIDEPEQCVVKSGERVSLRDPRLRDPACVIEAGATFSVQWDEYEKVLIKKVEFIVTPSCADETRSILLEQAAREKLNTMQSIPVDITRTDKPCGEKAKVDIVIKETGA